MSWNLSPSDTEGRMYLVVDYSRAAILKVFGLRTSFYILDLLRAPKSFCLCRVCLSVFTVLEVKAEKSLKCSLIHLKITITN